MWSNNILWTSGNRSNSCFNNSLVITTTSSLIPSSLISRSNRSWPWLKGLGLINQNRQSRLKNLLLDRYLKSSLPTETIYVGQHDLREIKLIVTVTVTAADDPTIFKAFLETKLCVHNLMKSDTRFRNAHNWSCNPQKWRISSIIPIYFSGCPRLFVVALRWQSTT